MKIEIEKESDSRWIAEIPDLPGVMAYGDTRADAVARVEALALRVIAGRLEHGEGIPELDDSSRCPHESLAVKQGTPGIGGIASHRLVDQAPGWHIPSCIVPSRLAGLCLCIS